MSDTPSPLYSGFLVKEIIICAASKVKLNKKCRLNLRRLIIDSVIYKFYNLGAVLNIFHAR
ncbi:MAG: hypothetical protein IJS29_04065 [Selenomonadaceae bacterium]|nr:hypothetical protein [Selenomonadaceae bacterium]